MNVASPSEAIVPTLDGPVLVALARLNGPVTGRQVHHLTGVGSEAGVRNVLNRLQHQGIVTAVPAGSAWLYSINRQHIAWPTVQMLAGLRGQLLVRLREAFEAWDPRPRSAALFGSAAREEGNEDSDIDIVVVRQRTTTPGETWLAQVAILREDVKAWTGNNCQVYDIGSDELQRHIDLPDPLVPAWRRDAITVSGADFRRLLGVRGNAS